MKISLACLVVSLSLGLSAPPAPPKISETFSCKVRNEAYPIPIDAIYTGGIKRDYDLGKQLSWGVNVIENASWEHDWRLLRCDINRTFSFQWDGKSSKPTVPCDIETSCNLSPMFAWTTNAKYNKTIEPGKQPIDVFNAMIDNRTLYSIAVYRDSPSIPYFFSIRNSGITNIYYYSDFSSSATDSSEFEIPKSCKR